MSYTPEFGPVIIDDMQQVSVEEGVALYPNN